MSIGLTNAPTTFMRLINEIFREHLGKNCGDLLDYILVFRKTWEDHFLHVCTMIDLFCTQKS
jgi:hypothetical protein